MPEENEIYPDKNKPEFDFGEMGSILEGKFRPGHFNGVAQVVKRLFEIVNPYKAYFGSKDFQQVMIVQELIKKMNFKIQLVSCPIIREEDGLAMSSRNVLLNSEERKIASIIPKIMNSARETVLSQGISRAKKFIENEIIHQPLMKLDYYEVCDIESLKPVLEIESHKKYISLIALFVGKIRLIDNLGL